MGKKLNVLLLGGWGYGNLGDTIILNETIKDLKKIAGNVFFKIITYKKETIYEENNFNFTPSLHKRIDLGTSDYIYQPIGQPISIANKFTRKILSKFCDNELCIRALIKINSNWIQTVLQDVDIVVMCGGGYFNEKWNSMAYATLGILSHAKKNGKKIIIYAPTIGNFSGNTKNIVKSTFSGIDAIAVRDRYSAERLLQLDIKSQVLSDVALKLESDNINFSNEIKKLVVNIIITTSDEVVLKKICSSLLNSLNTRSTYINIIITRWWRSDLEASVKLHKLLSLHGLNSKIILTESAKEVEIIMRSAKFTMSQNLHGMIMSVRSSIPVIPLNLNAPGSPNDIKIKGFAEQIGISDFLINEKFKIQELDNSIKMLIQNYEATITSSSTKIHNLEANRLNWLRKFFATPNCDFLIN